MNVITEGATTKGACASSNDGGTPVLYALEMNCSYGALSSIGNCEIGVNCTKHLGDDNSCSPESGQSCKCGINVIGATNICEMQGHMFMSNQCADNAFVDDWAGC